MNSINNLRVFTCALLLLILESCAPRRNDLPMVSPHHIAMPSSQFQERWSRGEIYTAPLSPSNPIGASSGLVCFIGAFHYEELFNVICMNGINDEVIWHTNPISSDTLIVTSDGVYIGRDGGGGGVTKYDLMGNILWVNYISGAGILYMYLVDNQLQVSVYPYKLFGVNSTDGKLMIQYLKDEVGFISTPADTFIRVYDLKAVVLETGQTKWEINLPGDLIVPPVFLEEMIILRTGDVMGSIYAIDRASGDTLWKTEDNVISNIAYSSTHHQIYYLTKEGKILSADINTGSESVLVEFTSTPFISISEDFVGSYDIAFDDTTNMLYVILGDSRQLFAFEENNP
jgi:outer membrane protein assembly factor BamB